MNLLFKNLTTSENLSLELENLTLEHWIAVEMKHIPCKESFPSGRFGLDIGPIVKEYKSPQIFSDQFNSKLLYRYLSVCQDII